MGRLATALALFSAALSGCSALVYPVPHYEQAVSKVNLVSPAPDPARLATLDPARVQRGRYLVDITGCAGCHTDGALIGAPNAARGLAGSDMGIAYTDPLRGTLPGVAYPPNLTPDARTGLGRWSDAQIAAAIRGGVAGSPAAVAAGHLAVMAWPLYRHLSDEDVAAIVAYLRSLPPVEHQVPARVPPGSRATTPYVYFGIFRSGPAIYPTPAP